jgi:serine/threonine-protein kinase
MVMGTTTYMSPEQARGLAVDWRTDIWSLGVVLYEMVGGVVPFAGPTKSDLVSNILHKEPPALTLLSDEGHERLDEIVTKALTKNKEERYQSAKDLFIDLKRLRQHLDVQAEIRRTSPPELRSVDGSAEPRRKYQTAAVAQASGTQTAIVEKAHPTSADHILAKIKRHTKGAIFIAALATVAIAASVLFLHFRSARVLTEKDTNLADGIRQHNRRLSL